ncbi:hypothetical protein BOTBODRAFT_51961 [Botryobasidium botryosum FD-172 SS1]|uniref:Uncharacterized protein n=1 Tax=Botryobasidium botryosum (strain FD-172 SS1) TaxID=930990 RepID=A0A067N654_BOTB1|nr:hypothetical protein BOTBODRAFT_51961 [Botryobasidium botryosum FD-172 SS1]
MSDSEIIFGSLLFVAISLGCYKKQIFRYGLIYLASTYLCLLGFMRSHFQNGMILTPVLLSETDEMRLFWIQAQLPHLVNLTAIAQIEPHNQKETHVLRYAANFLRGETRGEMDELAEKFDALARSIERASQNLIRLESMAAASANLMLTSNVFTARDAALQLSKHVTPELRHALHTHMPNTISSPWQTAYNALAPKTYHHSLLATELLLEEILLHSENTARSVRSMEAEIFELCEYITGGEIGKAEIQSVSLRWHIE